MPEIDLLTVWATDYQEQFLQMNYDDGLAFLQELPNGVLEVLNADIENGWGFDDRFLSALGSVLENKAPPKGGVKENHEAHNLPPQPTSPTLPYPHHQRHHSSRA